MSLLKKATAGAFALALLVGAFAAGPSPARAQARDQGLAAICGKTCRPEKFATCHGFLEGAVFDRSGAMWMVAWMAGEVLRVADGKCTVVGHVAHPNGAKFHPDGRMFITDSREGLLAFDPATGRVSTVKDTYANEHLRGTNDLVFDKAGGVYFTEPYGSDVLKPNGRVFYLPPGPDARLTLVADNIAFPNGIALSPDERTLYVADFARNRILSLPLVAPGRVEGIAFVFAQMEGGIGPDGVMVDAAGNVYAAHFRAGEVVVFDPQGFRYGSIRLPEGAGAMPTNLALHDGWLYITEAEKNEVWRLKTNIPGLAAPGP